MLRIFPRRLSSLVKSQTMDGNPHLYIHHHLGLGDMIHCNGMVRHLLREQCAEHYVRVFCKQSNYDMVQWMYRDEPRIQLLAIDGSGNESRQVRNHLRRENAQRFLSVGHKLLRQAERRHPHLFFDQLFYLQLDIPYQYRYSKCYWRRDSAEELRVLRKLAPESEFAFVHDDPSRGFVIDTRAIELPIVRNDLSENIFHLSLLLERASEIHCMESSIRCMIESLDMAGVRLYFHNFRYTHRPLGSATRHAWQIVDRKPA